MISPIYYFFTKQEYFLLQASAAGGCKLCSRFVMALNWEEKKQQYSLWKNDLETYFEDSEHRPIENVIHRKLTNNSNFHELI